MKIAYIIPQLGDRGMIRIPWYLAKKFKEDNHKVKVYHFGKMPGQKQATMLDFEDIPVERIDFKQFNNELNNFDIIHSHGFSPDLYIFINRKRIKPLKISTIHNYDRIVLRYDKGLAYGTLLGTLWDFARKRLDLCVCLTKTMEDFYKRLGYKNTTIIANGIEKPNVSEDLKSSQEAFDISKKIHLSTVSALVNWKGIDQVVRLLQLNKQCYFTAIGGNDNTIKLLQRLANDLFVADRCNFVGYQKNPWNIAIKSDIFIFPSRFEGLPLALVEAAQLEIPIICSDIPIFHDIFDDGEVTFFRLDDIDDLNQKIMNLNLDDLKMKTKRAKQKVDEKFTINIMYNNYHDLYQKLLKNYPQHTK